MTLIFDIETNGLLLEVDKFWVGCTYCKETKARMAYRCPYELTEALNNADLIVGHNIIGYDLPALYKLTGIEITTEVVDTLILAKLAYYDKDKSWGHSLDAYGERLGEKKGKYSDWSKYTKEMELYCHQDVEVTNKLYTHLKRKTGWLPKEALGLEQNVQKIVTQQYLNGWKFAIKEGERLHVELLGEYEEALKELSKTFKPKFIPRGPTKKPKKAFRRMGVYTVGEHQPISLVDFNPGSGNQIVWWVERELGKQEWILTEKGTPKTDALSLSEMFKDTDFLKPLLHYQEVKKLLGQLATGDKAWLKLIEKDGRLHGSMDILGTVSGRMSHSNPNLGQVPSIRGFKGVETRQLFIAEEGKVLVGCDLSGVELRCMAHFMTPYDKGRYSNIILQGDIHTANQEAAGLPTRDQAKTFCYATIYGAGDAKIGSIVGGGAKEGKRLKSNFLRGTPGYEQLASAIKKAAKKQWVRGISGRRLFVRSPHSAMNVVLQSLGAYIAKVWLVETDRRIREEGLDAIQISHVHDEITYESSKEDAEKVKKILEESAIEAGNLLNIRIQIDAEGQIGNSWADIH